MLEPYIYDGPPVELIAPFASWPRQREFMVAGRCTKCNEFGGQNAFLRIRGKTNYNVGVFCEECMLVLGVGQDKVKG